MAPTFDVFLSHNGQDKPAVEHVAERLRRAGMKPWLDKWELTPGGRWQDELHEGLQACRAFAYFLGPNGEGDWAREELDAARSRAAKDREFRIFPVLLPGTPDPFDRTTMPPFLGHRTWVDLRPGLDDPFGIQAFINAIKGVPLGAPEDLAVAAGAGDVSPYRGLDAFDEADAGVFFGREPDIQQLLEQLKSSRFLAVLGPSGSGKSSLVRAGLVPALRRGALPASATWRVEIVKPGARPAEAIAARLLAAGAGAAGMQGTLDGLLTDERSLHLAGSLLLGEAPDARLVWVVDQAEELFTLCHDDAERAAVIGNLTYAASVPGGRTIVVLAMRADFYARAAAYPDLAAQIARSQHLVAPLTQDGIRDAIEEPARTVGLAFEEGLVGTILDDLEGQPGSLPLLQYALLELWKRRRGGMLTLEGYRESGGVQGAIAKRAEAIYAAFTPEEQSIARRALLRLTQPGEGTEDTRRRASMRELVTRQDEAGEVDAVIEELTEARLLTTSADPATGEGLVDISHEALIRAWPRVREWLDEDRAGQRVLRRITEASAEWLRLGRDEGLLYRGARLAEAVEWREANDAMLNDDERAFLDASAALADRERRARERARRRLTVAASSLAAVFLVLAGLAGLQWLAAEDERRTADRQRQAAEAARTEADTRAREAEQQRAAAERARAQEATARAEAETARQLAETAQKDATGRAVAFQARQSETYLDRALLLALEAERRTSGADVRGLLLRELTAQPRLVRFFGELGPSIVWLDARSVGRAAWVDVAGTIRVVDLADPGTLLLEQVAPGGQGRAVVLSPDGRTVVGAAGSELTAWDVETGEQRWHTVVSDTPSIVRLAWVDQLDTPLVAAAEYDGSVNLFDATTGTWQKETIPPEQPLAGATALNGFPIAFDEDGLRYARAEQDNSIAAWNVLDGSVIVAPLKRPPLEYPSVDRPYTVTDLSWAPMGSQIVILYNDGLGLLSGKEGRPLTTLPQQIVAPLSIAVPDGIRLIEGMDGSFIAASANRGLRYVPYERFAQFDWETLGSRPFPYALDALADQGLVVAGYLDGRLALYDLKEHYPLATRLPVTVPPSSLAPYDWADAISKDGERFAWFDMATGRIRVQTAAGSDESLIPVDARFVEAIAFTDDRSSLVTVEDRAEGSTFAAWLVHRSLPDGEVRSERRLGPAGVRIAPTADGKRVLIGDFTGSLRLETIADGAVEWTARTDPDLRAITALRPAQDGHTVYAGANLGTGPFGSTALMTWDLATPDAAPSRLLIDADRISAIAETPGADRLVLALSDAQSAGDGRIVDLVLAEGRPGGSLGPPYDNTTVLRFAPDGRLLSGGPTGWFAWALDEAEWRRRACALAARQLSEAEWRDALGDEPYRATCPDLPERTIEDEPPAGGPEASAVPGEPMASPSPVPAAPPPSPGASIGP